MKYILITLLSFTFATQITTREFEVVIPLELDLQNGYDFYANFDVLEYTGIDYLEITPISISGISSNYGNMYFEIYIGQQICSGSYNIEYCEGGLSLINQEYSNIGILGMGNVNESITFKFWAKGAFEDEDSSMGDMNNDGSLNVYDVLILVGIILDGDSGDIFDVMEIIKRV